MNLPKETTMSIREPRKDAPTAQTGETKRGLGFRGFATVLVAGLALSMAGCDNNQPTDLPTAPATSDIASAPQTPGDTVANPDTDTPATAETDHGPAGDKPTTQDEFTQLIASRGYAIDGQTQISWFPPQLQAPVNQYGGQAQGLTCGHRFADVGYTYSMPRSDGFPDGAIGWMVDLYTDPNGQPDVHTSRTTLPDCSTLA